MSRHTRFWGFDFSLATTTTHPPENEWLHLFLGGLTFLWPLSPPTPPKNELLSSFLGGLTFLWPPPPLTPPKTSGCAHFQGFDLTLTTTTTHNPRKRAQQLVFGRLTFPWQSPPPTTPKNKPNGLFSIYYYIALVLLHVIIYSNKNINNIIDFNMWLSC